MTTVKVLMLRAPGTNCDNETAFAFQKAGAVTEQVHINRLIKHEKKVADYNILVISGGFTYGDDIAAGKILANEMKLKLGEDIQKFIDKGGLILGICNGFQVLAKSGFFGEVTRAGLPTFTLTNNDSNRFECRWVYLKINQQSPCIFTKGIEAMYLPIAHGEGKIMTEKATLDKLNVVVRYADAKGDIKTGYPHNPNGSVDNIAGICDATGRIFALMPHPERFISWSQHPRWTREAPRQHGDGLAIFLNAVDWVRHN